MQNIIAKIASIPKFAIIGSIRLYKKVVSPMLPPLCRFTPTCSEYMILSIQKHGIVKGLILGISRIVRCAPWCEGGYDPVPENFRIIPAKFAEEKVKQ